MNGLRDVPRERECEDLRAAFALESHFLREGIAVKLGVRVFVRGLLPSWDWGESEDE